MTDYTNFEDFMTLSTKVGGLDEIHSHIVELEEEAQEQFTRGYDEAVSECSVDSEFLDEKEKEIDQLKEENEELKDKVDTLEQQTEGFRVEYPKLEELIVDMKTEIESLKGEKDAEWCHIMQMNKEGDLIYNMETFVKINELKSEIEVFKNDISSIGQEYLSSGDETLDDIRDYIEEKTDRIEELTDELDEKDEEVNEVITVLTVKKDKEINRLKNMLDESYSKEEFDKMKEEFDKMKKELILLRGGDEEEECGCGLTDNCDC